MKRKNTINLESKFDKQVKPDTIDLSQITSIVNELNMIVAPTISFDLAKADEMINQRVDELNRKVIDTKKTNKVVVDLKKEKLLLIKRLKVVALLSELHGNFRVNSSVKVETLNLLRDIDDYSEKRLNLQIEKLEKILKN